MTTVEAPTTGRGRPRPEATIKRDDEVLEHLRTQGPKTRKQLTEELNLPGNEIYLSLYRLSRTDPPRVIRDNATWQVVAGE